MTGGLSTSSSVATVAAPAARGHRPALVDLWIFAVAIAALNAPLLLGGQFPGSLIFLPSAVFAGEWWRVVTHPFVHVTWYHLLLDAGAFLLLYGGLTQPSRARRFAYVAACGLGGLVACLLTTPTINTHGLCGLSGIAHGLMAICALEILDANPADPKRRRVAAVSFVAVVGEVIIEAATGHAFMRWLHFGLVGTPLVASHAGGVLGGLIAYALTPKSKGGDHP